MGNRRLARRAGLPAGAGAELLLIEEADAWFEYLEATRGQSEAIARNLFEMSRLETPIIATVIGEGGSGGAIALAAGNAVLMLEHAVYTVISPEGCASILWRDSGHAQEAAEALKLTAQDLFRLGVIDRIVPEPLGGAHRAPRDAIAALGDALDEALRPLLGQGGAGLREERRRKFL